jgi:hypothetical protein
MSKKGPWWNAGASHMNDAYRKAYLPVPKPKTMVSTGLPITPSPAGPPQGDPVGQAVASLRGYAYQIYVSAVAWLKLTDDEELYLEVAQDYAVAVHDALAAVQVKDVKATVTIVSEGVRQAI